MKREELTNDNNSSSYFLNTTMVTDLVLSPAVEQSTSQRRPWLCNGIHIAVRGDRTLLDSNQYNAEDNAE